MCKWPCKVPWLLLCLHFAVCVHKRGQIPHSLNYARCIFTVEPISSSIDSCSGTVLCCSCWYFNYRGNLSKSPQLLTSTLMRHLSWNQYCSSQPELSRSSALQKLSKRQRVQSMSRSSPPHSERVKSSVWGNSGRWPGAERSWMETSCIRRRDRWFSLRR